MMLCQIINYWLPFFEMTRNCRKGQNNCSAYTRRRSEKVNSMMNHVLYIVHREKSVERDEP